MNFLKQLWLSLRSNPYFVTAYSAALGAVLNALYQEVSAGSVNLSAKGLESLASTALGAAIIALWHLYTPKPGSTPNATN